MSTEEIIEDDGAEERRVFEIEAEIKGRKKSCQISAAHFQGMTWPLEELGAHAIVAPGLGLRDHARAAIQTMSGAPALEIVYRHTGWRRVDGEWVYLHAGGAIGAIGPITTVRVALEDGLKMFMLPPPPEADELKRAATASLDILSAAADTVTLPLFAMLYRSVLKGADFSVHLSGATGVGKSELAALAQRHFGTAMDARNLPASWSGTANANEELAFQAKDALLVVDDLVVAGGRHDADRLHREADRLLRAQGNSAGRRRMRADGALRPPRPPRGLLLSTGEDVPRGQSLRARMWIIEIAPEDVQWDAITQLQQAAAEGLFAQAMSGYIRYLAESYADLPQRFADELREARARAAAARGHRRTPDIVAQLLVGAKLWTEFAVDLGILTQSGGRDLVQRTLIALSLNAAEQHSHQEANDPATRFMELIRAAFVSGRAHLDGPDGGVPPSAEAWGWRHLGNPNSDPVDVDAPNSDSTRYVSKGDRIGWASDDGLFLDLDASLAIAQRIGAESGEPITVGPKTLGKRLHDRGLLVAVDGGRGRHLIRKVLDGLRRPVLHLRRDSLLDEESAQLSHSAQPYASAPWRPSPLTEPAAEMVVDPWQDN